MRSSCSPAFVQIQSLLIRFNYLENLVYPVQVELELGQPTTHKHARH